MKFSFVTPLSCFLSVSITFVFVSAQSIARITIDEFFNATDFVSVDYSPKGRYIAYHTRHPSWNTSSYRHCLWVYDTILKIKRLLTDKLKTSPKSKWSSNGNEIGFFVEESMNEQTMQVYSANNDKFTCIALGKQIPFDFTWTHIERRIIFTSLTMTQSLDDTDEEWKDVIQYRLVEDHLKTNVYYINYDISGSSAIEFIGTVPFIIGEFLFIPSTDQLILTSVNQVIERLNATELYSLDLNGTVRLNKLTTNNEIEHDLQLSVDGQQLFYRSFELSTNSDRPSETYERLFSRDLRTGIIMHLTPHFHGNIVAYSCHTDGTILILGQVGTETKIYTKHPSSDELTCHFGWHGSYSRVTSSKSLDSFAFVHSSFTSPKEIYITNDISHLANSQQITFENELFRKRQLPTALTYTWRNRNDNQTIEGILHYPPGKNVTHNLPLLVLIHGGLFTASFNHFQPDWENWAILAASRDWLVFEPNYRGSTGYGNKFLYEVRHQFLSRPASDVLSGVDQLIEDGIADRSRLAIGGYSYGAYLTNFIITRTTQFKAALSIAGAVEHVSAWGTTDLPIFSQYLAGGTPWEMAKTFQEESCIYHLDKVQTPTHIFVGEDDSRVNSLQSRILERGLKYLGVPVKLLIFPNEGHSIDRNPWHGKIMVREELKWLDKYVSKA